MTVTLVGFFQALPLGKSDAPSIVSFIHEAGHADEDRVVRYLRSGYVVLASGGTTKLDVINPTTGPAGSSDILSDGVWAWPAVLSHYVERYHVELPDSFISHARKSSWLVPDISDAVENIAEDVACQLGLSDS